MPCNYQILQKSIGWCEGEVTIPGIRRRIFYIAKSDIVSWPGYSYYHEGKRPNAVKLVGNFTLKENKTWKYIDVLPDKSQLTSEPQGEIPSQTQLNKLVAVHPGIGLDATDLAVSVNNIDCVYLVEMPATGGGAVGGNDKKTFRVLGNENWITKSTVSQDNGQGATGETSTTLNVEVSDLYPAPFYEGEVVTESGTINEEEEDDDNND